jgi:hypothetical protein
LGPLFLLSFCAAELLLYFVFFLSLIPNDALVLLLLFVQLIAMLCCCYKTGPMVSNILFQPPLAAAAAPACPAFLDFFLFPNRTVRQPDKLFTRTLKEEDEDESLSLFLFFIVETFVRLFDLFLPSSSSLSPVFLFSPGRRRACAVIFFDSASFGGGQVSDRGTRELFFFFFSLRPGGNNPSS